MERTESISIADNLIDELRLETKYYNDAIKNNKSLSEIREIRIKIKILVKELSKLLSENENEKAA